RWGAQHPAALRAGPPPTHASPSGLPIGLWANGYCPKSSLWALYPLVILLFWSHCTHAKIRSSYMRGSRRAPLLVTALMAVLVALTSPALTQQKPADTMELLHQKLKADKKLVVGANMDLTEPEAKRFWPVYEDYQRDLQKINQRIIALIER